MDYAYSKNMYDEAAEEIWNALFGLGSLKESLAYSQASKKLANRGFISEDFPGPETGDADFLKSAFETAHSYGFLDRPRPGFVRAILAYAHDYEAKDWERCVVGFMGENEDSRLGRDEVIRGAIAWAKENLGLQQKRISRRSKVWQYVERALNQTIRDKTVKQTVFYGVEMLQLAE